jgi:hypothetical protein
MPVVVVAGSDAKFQGRAIYLHLDVIPFDRAAAGVPQHGGDGSSLVGRTAHTALCEIFDGYLHLQAGERRRKFGGSGRAPEKRQERHDKQRRSEPVEHGVGLTSR